MIKKLRENENGSLLGTCTEQDLKRTQGETIHSYPVQAVSQVLHLYAVHTVKEGTISLPIGVECNHFHAETT